MKRVHYVLLGLLVSLTIAAVAPSLPPTRIAPGTGITVTTNGLNSFTLSANGDGVTGYISNFTGFGTNVTIYSSASGSNAFSVFSASGLSGFRVGGTGISYADRGLTSTGLTAYGTVQLQETIYVNGPLEASSTTLFNGTNTFAGRVNLSGLTASRLLVNNSSGTLTNSSVTETEAGYLSGVTNAIQTQLNAKPTVALTNVATQNGANSFTAAQTYSSTITVNGTGGDYIILNGSVGGVPKLTLFNSGIGNIELTANSAGGLSVNANVSAPSFTSANSFYGNGAIGSIVAGGSGGTITNAGVVSLWSAAGTAPYISLTENAGGNRGVIGYGAGSGDLVIKTGAETFTGATNELFRLTSAGSVGIGTASPSARLHVVGGGLRIGSAGTTLTNYASATATLDFGSIAAQTSADLTISVTGATTNDIVTLGLPAAPTAGIMFQGFVSAANTVTVRAHNYTAGAIDPASATYRVAVTSH